MIHENDVNVVIGSEIPDLAVSLAVNNKQGNIFKAISALSDYTKVMIREHRMHEVNQCFETAYELLQEGTAVVKMVTLTIYISSVCRLMEHARCDQDVKNAFLSKFSKEYYQLIYSNNP